MATSLPTSSHYRIPLFSVWYGDGPGKWPLWSKVKSWIFQALYIFHNLYFTLNLFLKLEVDQLASNWQSGTTLVGTSQIIADAGPGLPFLASFLFLQQNCLQAGFSCIYDEKVRHTEATFPELPFEYFLRAQGWCLLRGSRMERDDTSFSTWQVGLTAHSCTQAFYI